MRFSVVFSALALTIAACGDFSHVSPAEEIDGIEPEPAGSLGFSCAGEDEYESEQLAFDCAALGGECSGDTGRPGPYCVRELGFSCAGADEYESEQLAFDCAELGGVCSGDTGRPGPYCVRE